MTGLPIFRRDVLFKAFNGDVTLVSAFEQLVQYVTDAASQAGAGAVAANILASASILALTSYEGLSTARLLTPGAGVAFADADGLLTVSLNDLTPKIGGGFPVTFIVTGETHLILPTLGTLATLADVGAAVSGAVTSFNTRTGAVTLTGGDVTTALGFTPYNATNPSGYISGITSGMVTAALGYTPTSVTGLAGVQSVAAFKTGLTLVKADVGLGSVDNTADAAKVVLSASKLTTARNINGVAFDGTAAITVNLSAARTIAITGDVAWSVSFDGSANVTAAGTLATVNANTGAWGSATQSAQITLDGKGRATAAANVTITPAFSALTGKPTTLSGYGITDAQPLGSMPVNTQTGAYTVVLADKGGVIYRTTGAGAVTIPPSVFSAGDWFEILNVSGAGISLTRGAGVSLFIEGSAVSGDKTLAQVGMTRIYCNAANSFVARAGGGIS